MIFAAAFISKFSPISSLFVSDLLLSDGKEKWVWNGLSPSRQNGLPHPTLGVDLVQKMHICGKYLFLWAGIRIETASIVRELERLKSKKFNEVKNYLTQYSDLNLRSLSWALFHFDGKRIKYITNSFSDDNDETIVVSMGSGSGDLYWDEFGPMKSNFTHPLVCEEYGGLSPALRAASQRLGEYFYRETQFRMDIEKAYGSGLEWTVPLKSGGFKKMNYSLCHLLHDGESWGLAAKYHFKYKSKLLTIVSIFAQRPTFTKGQIGPEFQADINWCQNTLSDPKSPRINFPDNNLLKCSREFMIAESSGSFKFRPFARKLFMSKFGSDGHGKLDVKLAGKELNEYFEGIPAKRL
ncbi:hypothetical protein [uncultured Roseobacter sp.]|uniref:hypothetical protein n=1 Tax=uncultured Roseobacter sp. TaxID=114847 RepID=UPI00262273EC|nr:hypothetical protein [uncultured Roseobacter sp.]